MDLYINIFIGFCVFIIGSLFGSFFSLAIYRIPRHQDILVKRSYCPTCKHNLGFLDLIPILSYICCKGKCRYCKEKISLRYLFLEISNAIIFVILYIIFGYTIKFLIVSLVYVVLFVLIGSYIMGKNMKEDEVNNIKNMRLQTKKGVYITEIVVAMILFTLLLVSSYIISRNYNKSSMLTIARSNAVSLAIKNIETAKATDYDILQSYTMDVKENDVNYTINVDVIPFDDLDSNYENIVKKINVNVKYNISGNPYEYSISSLKGKVST